MTARRSLMKILAGATLLGVARRASAQKVKSVTIAYLALLAGEDRNFVPIFCAVSISLVTLTDRTCTSSIAPRKAGRQSQDGQGLELYGAANDPDPRRQDHRMSVATSEIGTRRTCRGGLTTSALEGTTDVPCKQGHFRV